MRLASALAMQPRHLPPFREDDLAVTVWPTVSGVKAAMLRAYGVLDAAPIVWRELPRPTVHRHEYETEAEVDAARRAAYYGLPMEAATERPAQYMNLCAHIARQGGWRFFPPPDPTGICEGELWVPERPVEDRVVWIWRSDVQYTSVNMAYGITWAPGGALLVRSPPYRRVSDVRCTTLGDALAHLPEAACASALAHLAEPPVARTA